jgi:cell division protein FtsB
MPLFKSNPRLATIVACVVALVIIGGVIWGFAQQLALAKQIRAEEERLENEMAAEQARYEELTTKLEYVSSDEYVEYWARTEAHMTRLGETVVIMITETGD